MTPYSEACGTNRKTRAEKWRNSAVFFHAHQREQRQAFDPTARSPKVHLKAVYEGTFQPSRVTDSDTPRRLTLGKTPDERDVIDEPHVRVIREGPYVDVAYPTAAGANFMNYANLLTDLGMETRLDFADAVRNGTCTIEFDGSLQVTLEAGDSDEGSQSVVYVHAVIGEAPLTNAETLFGRLLQIHLFGFATADGTFSFQADSRQILFFKTLRLAKLSQPEAINDITSFVNQALRWRAHLPRLAANDAAELPPETPLDSLTSIA